MSGFQDLTGKRYGKLTVIERAENKSGRVAWKCQCDCGKTTIALAVNLVHDRTHSCGCTENNKEKNRTHGMSKTRLYKIWKAIHFRCNNPKCINYQNYGGRGIKVCEEWDKFESFRDWALSNGYNDDLSIDRLDNSKGYSANNCRWIDEKNQARNRRNTLYIEHDGVTKPLIEWCELLGYSYDTLRVRYRKQKQKTGNVTFESIFY